MIFFTRELYRGIQPFSGWDRRANNEWTRRAKIYFSYFKAIKPMLPAALRRLCVNGLHDARLDDAFQSAGQITMLFDTSHSLSGFRGRQVRLAFRGVKNKPRLAKLVGQEWLYEEVHLCSRARFSLQVLFEDDELEIEADELRVYLSKNARRRRDA